MATSRRSPEDSAQILLGRMVMTYQQQEGRYPSSWEEMEGKFPGLDEKFPALLPTQRMALLNPPLTLSRQPGSRFPTRFHGRTIVLVTRDSYRPQDWRASYWLPWDSSHLQDPVHGVVMLSPETKGVILERMKPESLRRILVDNGRELPGPSGLGMYPHELAHYRGVTAKWILIAIAAVFLVASIRVGLKRRSGKDALS